MKNYNEDVMNGFIKHSLIGKHVTISSSILRNRKQCYSGILLSLCDGFALLDERPLSDYMRLISITNMHIREGYL